MRKIILLTAVIAAATAAVIMFMQLKIDMERKEPSVEFTVSLKREELTDLIEEKMDIPGLDFVSGFIPETIEISCRAELTGEGKVPISVSGLSVNGQEIPYELCEKYLDFSCSLVYN